MPRLARLDAQGALHHLMIRGIERRKIFLKDRDRGDFLDRLSSLLPEAESPSETAKEGESQESALLLNRSGIGNHTYSFGQTSWAEWFRYRGGYLIFRRAGIKKNNREVIPMQLSPMTARPNCGPKTSARPPAITAPTETNPLSRLMRLKTRPWKLRGDCSNRREMFNEL
jgi:hypothetical protein